MNKQPLAEGAPTMIIPGGTEISVDAHGQLSIKTPGNLVIQNSGSYGTIESVSGSIRIESRVQVEAVQVRCAEACYVQGNLTAWKVTAKAIQLENSARAHIVLQETDRLEVGKDARLVGNFSSEKELFLLFSRFARQLRSIPFYFDRKGAPRSLPEQEDDAEILVSDQPLVEVEEAAAEEGEEAGDELPDPLFFGLVLLERDAGRSGYGPTSQRVIEELIKLLRDRDLETLRHTYKTLFSRIVEPGEDVKRAEELIRNFLLGS